MTDADAAAREHIASLDPPRRDQMLRLHEVFRAAAPELDVRLWQYSGTLIGYGTYPYRSSSGAAGDWFVLGLANRKSYISVYSMALDAEQRTLVSVFHDRMPGTKIGKSCVNVLKPDLLDDAVLAELAATSAAYHRDHLAH